MRETTVTCDGCGFVDDVKNDNIVENVFDWLLNDDRAQRETVDLCKSCFPRFNELRQSDVVQRLLSRIVKGDIKL